MINVDHQRCGDGTQKYLWLLEDGATVESLSFPYHGRLTSCISSQVGCPVRCPFCETGKQGLQRNLTAEEIVGQVAAMVKSLLQAKEVSIFEIVTISGMGEPLLNFDNLALAVAEIKKRGLAKEISITTSGISPKIYDLAHIGVDRLSISLHATTDELRDRLVPVNKKYSISSVLDAARYFHQHSKDRVRATYLLLDGLNDSNEDLQRLMDLLDRDIFRIRLRNYNSVDGAGLRQSTRVAHFEETLKNNGFDAYISNNSGVDIEAGCGQLRSRYVAKETLMTSISTV